MYATKFVSQMWGKGVAVAVRTNGMETVVGLWVSVVSIGVTIEVVRRAG